MANTTTPKSLNPSVPVEQVESKSIDPQVRLYTILRGNHTRLEKDGVAVQTGGKPVTYNRGEQISLSLAEARSPAFAPDCDGARLEVYHEPTQADLFDFSHLADEPAKLVINTIRSCDSLDELDAIARAEYSRKAQKRPVRTTVEREIEAKKEELLAQ